MKVLHVINSLGAGGAEQSLVELIGPMGAAGIELEVATLGAPAAGVVPRSGRELPVSHVGGRNLADTTRRLRRLLKARRPSLVHTSLFEADVAGRVAGRAAGVPVMTSLVNTMYDPARLCDPAVDARRLRAVRSIDAWTARHLTLHFHAITHAVKDSCVQTMGLDPDRVTVVERGRDRARLGSRSEERRLRVREALGLAPDARVVVNVGRQEWQKAQTNLVEAFDVVAAQVPEAHLLIVGRPGHASDDLARARERSRAAERVHVLGHREDVGDLLGAADLFVFPSRYEGLGGSVIEAMAMGLPVVVTRIPALVEVVEESRNADVVDPGDPAALGRAIAGLLVDAERRERYGRRSEEIFDERFTLEHSVAGMVALYEDVLGRIT